MEKIGNDIENLERNKASLLQSKSQIDESLLKVDITTLTSKIERSISEGKAKSVRLIKSMQK